MFADEMKAVLKALRPESRGRANAVALFLIMSLWAVHLGYPMRNLQFVRWTFWGYVIPLYYVFTVFLVLGTASLLLVAKRRWSRWELLWWALPLICLPGIFHSDDPMWSARQWFSWAIRGMIPGGIIILASYREKAKALLLFLIYPVVIAASLLGLSELYCGHNPLWDTSYHPIPATSQPANPFYRPGAELIMSEPPTGTQGNRIPYAATLVGFFPLGLWLLKYKKEWYWTNLFAVGALSSILILAQVRAVWVGASVAILLMPIAGLRWNRREIAGIVAGVLLCLGVALAWPTTRHMLWLRLNSFHFDESSIRVRLSLLRTALVLKDRWFAGVGFGQFAVSRPYYHGTWPWIETPENQYLRWAIENGLVSFGLLGMFFIGLVRAGWKKIQLMADIGRADFYRSLLVGWLSLATTFVFFDGFYWGACNMTFWCFLGLFATCLSSGEGDDRDACDKSAQ